MKYDYLITFRSITYAQRGQKALSTAGIAAHLRRTPRELSSRGCGYCLMVGQEDARRAAEVLQQQNIAYGKVYRRTERGLEERSL